VDGKYAAVEGITAEAQGRHRMRSEPTIPGVFPMVSSDVSRVFAAGRTRIDLPKKSAC
jgi:hypothetical protein